MMSWRLSTIAKTLFVFGFSTIETKEMISWRKLWVCWKQKEKGTMKSITIWKLQSSLTPIWFFTKSITYRNHFNRPVSFLFVSNSVYEFILLICFQLKKTLVHYRQISYWLAINFVSRTPFFTKQLVIKLD